MTEDPIAAPVPAAPAGPSAKPTASPEAGGSSRSARWTEHDAPQPGSRARTVNPHSPLHEAAEGGWNRETGTIDTDSLSRRPRNVRKSWEMRLMPDALDRLREHPHFNLEDQGGPGTEPHDTTQEILLSHAVVEEDREPLYHLELLRMFRQRLRLLGILGLALLPIFHFFYAFLSPRLAAEVLFPHLLMMLTCGTYLLFSRRIQNLVWARLLTVVGYALVCTSASLVMATVSQSPLEASANRSIQFVILAAHSQILLSTVLLPLSLWESLVMTVIVGGSLTWSAWWIVPDDTGPARTAQIFVLAMTAVFVLCVAQFQSFLRRRAFDSAFDLARSAAQLRALSTLDAVTGGFNRLHLEKTLSIEINRAARFSHPLSVVMFDLDNFKIINDTLGHTSGDEVLRTIWHAATTAVRDVDTVARYGGDEFLIVLPETESADAFLIAQRLQEAATSHLQSYFLQESGKPTVTLSIGVVTISPSEPLAVPALISLADERLYEAKRMGKNRIAV